MPPDSDPGYLWDMRAQADMLMELLPQTTEEAFLADPNIQAIFERRLEIIGEAASHLSRKFREEHDEIPWQRIIGLRNVLAHDYGRVIPERIWETATAHLPELVQFLDQLPPET